MTDIEPTPPMSPKRRFLAGILGGRTDIMPVGSPTSVATVEQMDLMEAQFPFVHLVAAGMARLAAGAYEILGYDAIMPVFSVSQEAAALGCDVDWGSKEDMPVARNHPFAEPEDIRQLAQSIAAHGLLQPIVVVMNPSDGMYDIVAGHLRFDACKHLGWKTVPAVVREAGKPAASG